MLKPKAFANSIAAVVAVFFVVLYGLQIFAPVFFDFIFTAQFYGADVATLIPPGTTFGQWLWSLITVAVTAWLMGYLWAWFYNRFAKKK